MAGARSVQQKKFRSRKHMLPAVALARHASVVALSIFPSRLSPHGPPPTVSGGCELRNRLASTDT